MKKEKCSHVLKMFMIFNNMFKKLCRSITFRIQKIVSPSVLSDPLLDHPSAALVVMATRMSTVARALTVSTVTWGRAGEYVAANVVVSSTVGGGGGWRGGGGATPPPFLPPRKRCTLRNRLLGPATHSTKFPGGPWNPRPGPLP